MDDRAGRRLSWPGTALPPSHRRGIMTAPTRTSSQGGTPVRIRLLLVTTCVSALLAGPMCLPSGVVSPALAQQPTPQGGANVTQKAVITIAKGGEITIAFCPEEASHA